MPRESNEIYEFGEFRLDVAQHRIERMEGGTRTSLPEKAFQTLVHLVRNNGTLVTKDELLSVVWPDTVVEENNLGKAVHAIRHLLGESSRTYIETVPKHGYRFIAPVTRRSAENGSASQPARSNAVRSPAWDLYLRGKVKVGSENREDTEAAIKILEEAVAIDPELAGAYAQLARGYNTLAFKFSSAETAKQLHEDAEVAILKSLALDPNLAEGHFARGLILWTKRKGFPHEQAIKSYQRALELDPNDDETHHQLSMVYSHVGLIDEALESVARALDLNPNNTMARFRAGLYQAYKGNFESSVATLKTIPRDVSPLLVYRAMADALVQLGKLDDADAIVDHYLQEYPADEGGSFTSVKAVVLAKRGKKLEAEKAIRRAAEIGSGFGHFHHTAHNIASAYAAMDDPDAAVSWLEKAAEDGFPNFSYFELDPNLDPLRTHPAFSAFLSKLRPEWLRLRELAAGRNHP
jgi:DNA-binding winged helix-turn-helix (wHTH) protein/Flp pilus assembly protein TadD